MLIENGSLFTASDETGRLIPFGALTDAHAELDDVTTGSRTYKRGVVLSPDSATVRRLMDTFAVLPKTTWVVWDNQFIRISAAAMDDPSGTCVIVCSQGARIGFAVIDGVQTELTLVEPSPPQPQSEWVTRERARAIRDLVGDQRPLVLIPFTDWDDEC